MCYIIAVISCGFSFLFEEEHAAALLCSYGAGIPCMSDIIYDHTCIWSSCDVVCMMEWHPIPISTGDRYLINGEISLITLEGHTSPFTCAGKVPQQTMQL